MERITAIEYLRALCVLYIVGFWHLFDYTPAFSTILMDLRPLTERLTYTALAIFVFVSGYLLGGKKNKEAPVSNFLKRRLFRIIPLYFLALSLFYLFSIDHSKTLLKAVFGISMFYGPAPQTLWFICMLLFLYSITPLLLKTVDEPIKFIGTAVVLMLTMLVIKIFVPSFDARQILYFPAFIAGLYCANFGFNKKLFAHMNTWLLLTASVLVSFIHFNSATLNILKFMPMVTVASYLTLALCERYEGHFKSNKIIFMLSYASFCMYLFHRPIFIAMQKLYYPSNPLLQALYLLGPCLIVIFIFAWSIQKAYDKTLNLAKF